MNLTMIELIVYGVIIVGVVLAILIWMRKEFKENAQKITTEVENGIRESIPEALKQADERLVTLANEKLGAEKKEIRADLEGKRDEIGRLIKQIQEDLKRVEQDRVGSFKSLETQLVDYKEVTKQLATSTDNLKRVLSNNQLRGQFGEQVADELLRMSGFTRGVDYIQNISQEKTDTRPDFTVFLPDKTRINVDAKFPYSNLQHYTEVESTEEKRRYLDLFKQDVKEKVKQVTSRDYIDPEQGTVDFVILFIPNEMIYSFIYDKMNDVWTDAMERKVVMAGPFSLTAILRLIKQSYDNFRYQQNIQSIVGHIKAFEQAFAKWNIGFNKIGERIESLQKEYMAVSTTRTNVLSRRMDKVLQSGDIPTTVVPELTEESKK
jgi:DNA recombination protein RmuC